MRIHACSAAIMLCPPPPSRPAYYPGLEASQIAVSVHASDQFQTSQAFYQLLSRTLHSMQHLHCLKLSVLVHSLNQLLNVQAAVGRQTCS